MESMVVSKEFWKDRNVLITGHTGFKGSWLSLWMQQLGANVVGVSIDPPTQLNLYEQADVSGQMLSIQEDIRNGPAIKKIFLKHRPEVVFHLAAQSLVRYSYNNPVETYESNVMGTLHILEGIRSIDTVRAAVMVTTDKCYKNMEWLWGYREDEPMGGRDLYSSSKGSAELLISSYRDSFYSASLYDQHRTAIATARSGNVIGGGDWAVDRLIPDIVRAFHEGNDVYIRYPNAVRPWQHVLEPLSGYIELAERLTNDGSKYAEAWNFGPKETDSRSVEWIIERMKEYWGGNASWILDNKHHLHEENYLKLDCSKVNSKLDWHPKWDLDHTLLKTIEWYKSYFMGNNCKETCLNQIREYTNSDQYK